MAFFIVIIALLILLVTWFITIQKKFRYWKNKNVFYERPIPVFGNILNVALRKEQIGNVLKRIYDKTDESEPYFGVFLFHTTHLVLKSPELIKQVLIEDFSTFTNTFPYVNERIDPVFSNILFTSRNEVWKNLRNKLTPIFTPAKLKNMISLIKEATEDLEAYLNEKNDEEIDVRDVSKKYNIDVISSCTFGINAHSLRDPNSEIKLMIEKLLDMKGFKRSFAVFAWFFCPILVDILRIPFFEPKACQFLTDVYKKSAEGRERNEMKRNDMIDLLNELKSDEKADDLYKFDLVRMCAQAIMFFNEGAGGTSSLLALCLYELAINPEIQMALRKEIKSTLESSKSTAYNDFFEMEYLDLVIKETLRKYPFLQFIQRYAEKDYIFEKTGLKIEKGTPIMIPVVALNYDPKIHPNPEKFDPERFRGNDMKRLQYLFLPFGDGPRKCIGERLGLLSVKMGIAAFLKNHQVVPGRETDIPIQFNEAATFLTPKNGSIYLKILKINN